MYALIDRLWRGAKRNAGITRKITPHWLRHFFASVGLSMGVPVSDVAEWLGHRPALAVAVRGRGGAVASGSDHSPPVTRSVGRTGQVALHDAGRGVRAEPGAEGGLGGVAVGALVEGGDAGDVRGGVAMVVPLKVAVVLFGWVERIAEPAA
ncbi:tyrosine-type recombinase/integrase [Streptomyces roseoviridis]|uniref:tyrosine-type recombinase/integrase n=1 Tax=Streptomyces roseoviridis TaxID=67361 RepID=UPI0031EFE686